MTDLAATPRRQTPIAIGDDLRRFWSLTMTLAVTEFKLRYFGSVLGYLWSLLRPLLLFGVLYIVFTNVVRFDDVAHYPAYLLSSIMLWTFFAEATSGCVTCLVDRENLLRKIRFPRMTIPLSVALTALFNLGMNLIALLVFFLLGGIDPTWTWLWAPVLVGALFLFALGLGLGISVLFVRYRDMRPIWEVILQMGFYATPVIYAITTIPESAQRWVALNPIAVIFTQWRHWIIDPSAPGIREIHDGAIWTLFPIVLVLVVCVAGFRLFQRDTPRIAENL
jgi:ABC-2 type transport system permease protein